MITQYSRELVGDIVKLTNAVKENESKEAPSDDKDFLNAKMERIKMYCEMILYITKS